MPSGGTQLWSSPICCTDCGKCGFCCYAYCCTSCAYGGLVGALPPAAHNNSSAGCRSDQPCCPGTCIGPCMLHCLASYLPVVPFCWAAPGSWLSALIFVKIANACGWTVHLPLRRSLARKYNIEQSSLLEDCCTVTWCEPCALAQQHHELGHAPRTNAAQPMPMPQLYFFPPFTPPLVFVPATTLDAAQHTEMVATGYPVQQPPDTPAAYYGQTPPPPSAYPRTLSQLPVAVEMQPRPATSCAAAASTEPPHRL
jgi:hypothetical protein